MKDNIKIGIVGLWHLGCVLSAAWSKLGFEVVGFDYSKELINNLNQNHPPIFEPGLEDLFDSAKKGKRLNFISEISGLADCNFIFLTYDTPVLDNDESDLTPLKKAINAMGAILKNNSIVVVSSQTPAGVCCDFRNELKGKNPTLELVYSPENLRLGEAIECYLNPGRIIIGAESEDALSKTHSLFKNICSEIVTMNLSSAEMVKHGINSYLAMSITFSNHLSDLCEAANANIFDVVKGMKTDPRIGPKAYLSPGIGFSGGTLGRDLRVLEGINNKFNKKADLFEDIHRFNSKRKYSIIGKIRKLCDSNLESKKIGILGITYKPGTSTLRRSLPMEIVEIMLKERAVISIFDPKANYNEYAGEKRFIISGSSSELIKRSDLIVLLTEWPEFKLIPWNKYLNAGNPQIIFDTKNFLSDIRLRGIGYRYYGIGYNA